MATISVRRFDYETLKTKLSSEDTIAIVSCDCCARFSEGLGGRESMDGLGRKLEADGFRVVRRQLVSEACSAEALAKCMLPGSGNEGSDTASVVIPLACEMGEEATDRATDGIPVLRIAKTLGKGNALPGKGMRLTEPNADVDLDVDPKEGMTIEEAAKRLGLYPGQF
jgi:hypothetical protein